MCAIMYDKLTKAYAKRMKEVKRQRLPNARDDLTELNAYFAALIANMGMYLGCVPNKISSKRPDILTVHNEATHAAYDSSFAYRLFCMLRNYTLHDTPPITGIRGSSRSSKKTAGEREVSYEVLVEKDKLQQNDRVARKLAADFALPGDRYPVIELAAEAMDGLRQVHWKTMKALLAPIAKEITVIESLVALVGPDNQPPYIVSFLQNPMTGKLDAELNLVPTQILDIRATAAKY